MNALGWKKLIEEKIGNRPLPVKAVSYGKKKWETATKPVLLVCCDGREYVVKGRQVGGPLVVEQIVAALGRLLSAPVPGTPWVDVPAALIAAEKEMSHMAPGIGHGCLYVPNSSERTWIQSNGEAENKDRHARLAILYGWVRPNDQQLIYELNKPSLVWSVDHGNFSVCRPEAAAPYADIVHGAKVTNEDLASIRAELESIQPSEIASAVAAPHESWGITIDQRVSYAQHLQQKLAELTASIPAANCAP